MIKYLKNTKIEDLTGLKYGRLTVVEFDWDKYEKDKIKKHNGEIENVKTRWLCACSCGKTKSILGSSLKNGTTTSCGCYKIELLNKRLSGVKTTSFEQWCLDNNHQDYLDLWDYELNDICPSLVPYGTHKKYYFKCKANIHKSEEWGIHSITNLNKNITSSRIKCRQCNSIGQYLLNTYGSLNIWTDKKDAFIVAKLSSKKYLLMCPTCKEIKNMTLSNFVKQGFGCVSCGDGQSYPNKFMWNFLNHINTSYDREKVFDWSNCKRYDCYIPTLKTVIENHGGHHYNRGFGTFGGKSTIEEQANDKLKRELALSNGIKHYIELDCRKSELEWIKNSIMDSELPNLLNFKEEDVDWADCHKKALKSLIPTVCKMWETGNFNTVKDLCEYIDLPYATTLAYLKKGRTCGLTRYDSANEMEKKARMERKKVEVIKDGKSMGIFDSLIELERVSFDQFGVKFYASNIGKVCLGIYKQHKGYFFKYN